MIKWYNKSIRNQLYFALVLIILCSIVMVSIFSFLVLHTLNVTGALISQQEKSLHLDAEFRSAHQAITLFLNSHNSKAKETYTQHIHNISQIDTVLHNSNPGIYTYSLHQVIKLYTELGDIILESIAEGDSVSAMTQFRRLEQIRGTIEYILPYAQSEVADTVSQHIRNLEQQQRKITSICISALILVCFAVLILTSKVISRIIDSLHFLTEIARKVEREEWLLDELPNDSADELGLLTRTMYHMADTIHAQIEEIEMKATLEQQLQQKEREALQFKLQVANLRLKVLQDQIKPHFLFNCLNLIAKLAYIESAQRCQKATSLIARYLRGVLDHNSDTSSLEEEFSCLQDYCRIQEMRFGDHFSFTINCDDSLLTTKIPSMTLQPLVENAFIHGLDKCTRKGWVHCSAFRAKDKVCIRIEDNGTGLSQERIDWIYKSIQDTNSVQTENAGIGLIGTAKRLLLYFGNQLELKIQSTEGAGTVVVFQFPHLT